MRSRACVAVAMAIAPLALPSIAAGADPEPGVAAAQFGTKDYSKNSAGGDYARSDESAAAEALRIRGEALNEAMAASDSATAAAGPTPKADSGFEWDDAAIGAGVALALVALLAGLAVVRHRIGDAGASPARTYGS
jgi:hypothetical protein